MMKGFRVLRECLLLLVTLTEVGHRCLMNMAGDLLVLQGNPSVLQTPCDGAPRLSLVLRHYGPSTHQPKR